MELGEMVNGKITSQGVSVLPCEGEGTEMLKGKARPVESRQQEGTFPSADHKPGGSFCGDNADPAPGVSAAAAVSSGEVSTT